jgi:hypothetical protein
VDWGTDAEDSAQAMTITSNANDNVIKVYYVTSGTEPQYYTITYVIEGSYFTDETYFDQHLSAGDPIQLWTAQSHSNYTFSGWKLYSETFQEDQEDQEDTVYLASISRTLYEGTTMPSYDLVAVGSYTYNPPPPPPPGPTYYTLTVKWVDADGNNLATPETVTKNVGESYNANTDTASGGSGRTFDGYTISDDLYTGSDPISADSSYTSKTVIFVYTANEEITDEPGPLTDTPEEIEEITEEAPPLADVPLVDAPPTGESILLYFLITLLLASGSGLAWIVRQEYRERLVQKKK